MAGATPNQTVGPYFHIGLEIPVLASGSDPDQAELLIGGVVRDGAGEAVGDAMLEFWRADGGGSYAAGESGASGFDRVITNDEGRYELRTGKPGPVPAPEGATQAPHIAVAVFARGLLRHLITRIYFPDEPDANAADPALSLVEPERRSLLVAVAEEGGLRFDIQLQGERETPFFDV